MGFLFRDIIVQWCHNERDGVSNHRRLDCLLNYLFRCRWEKISKLRVTGLCEGNPPVNVGFPSQRASKAVMFPFDNVIMNSFWSKCRCVRCVLFSAKPLLTSPVLMMYTPAQTLTHFTRDKMTIFSNAFSWMKFTKCFTKISLKFVGKVRMKNISVLVQIMVWRRPGDRPLSGRKLVSFLAHICVPRPQ